MLISRVIVEELNDTLRRKGFARDSVLVEIVERMVVCHDPKDDKFLERAVNGKATCIVSGDEDLLVLHPFRGIAIVSPRQFLEFPLQSASQPAHPTDTLRSLRAAAEACTVSTLATSGA